MGIAHEEETVADVQAVETYADPGGGATVENNLVNVFNSLSVFDDHQKEYADAEIPRMRYLLDASLNKLCRWLRILGQDAALETDEEEKLRTGDTAEMVIFQRCLSERRTLVTTSPRLMQRRDCPPSVYCIHPPFLSKLEVALIHMLLTHGVVLDPSTFLSRCVVCNGNIVEEHDDTAKRRILNEYEAPSGLIDEGMAVYECDGCHQGYWWNDRPTSSASRVKTAATRLLELCIRGGVPIRGNDDPEGLFQHVNVDELRKQGWDWETPGSGLLQQRLDVLDWLKDERLECPFALESAYARKTLGIDGEAVAEGECLPFTNVTHHFVDTLDYIFFDKTRLQAVERLYVPKTFRELGDGRTSIESSHLLPSDVWPSDHLTIGARLSFLVSDEATTQMSGLTAPSPATDAVAVKVRKDVTTLEGEAGYMGKVEGPALADTSLEFCAPIGGAPPQYLFPKRHGERCACGCVPDIPSLFEMAELRKQAKLKSLNGAMKS